MEKIKLGGEYKDKITGFAGVATGYVKYITGCNQVLLAPKVKKGGDRPDASWFDEQRLTQVGRKVIVVDNSDARGFDAEPPKR